MLEGNPLLVGAEAARARVEDRRACEGLEREAAPVLFNPSPGTKVLMPSTNPPIDLVLGAPSLKELGALLKSRRSSTYTTGLPFSPMRC